MIRAQAIDGGAGLLLSRMGKAVANAQPFWDEAGKYMVRRIAKAFQVGGIPHWQASRRAGSEGGKTMLLSNRLRNSIAFDASPKDCFIGTNVPYARLQNEGGIVKPKKAKALAIPLNAKARRAAEKVTSIREIKGLFFVKVKSSGAIGILAKRASSSYDADTGTLTTETVEIADVAPAAEAPKAKATKTEEKDK